MTKIHTRIKRKFFRSTHAARKSTHAPAGNRPRTFKTEGSAHEWAKKNGLKEGSYTLELTKKNKKFRIAK